MKSRKRATPTPMSKILRRLMTERGLTVRAAAAAAKVSPSTVDDWRAGAVPENYAAVKRLSLELGVSFEFLLTGEDSKAHSPSSITEVFDDGGSIFDGYAKITIQRLIPRGKK